MGEMSILASVRLFSGVWMHSELNDNTDKSYYDWQWSALDVERKDTHLFFLLSISFLLALMAITSMVIFICFYDRP